MKTLIGIRRKSKNALIALTALFAIAFIAFTGSYGGSHTHSKEVTITSTSTDSATSLLHPDSASRLTFTSHLADEPADPEHTDVLGQNHWVMLEEDSNPSVEGLAQAPTDVRHAVVLELLVSSKNEHTFQASNGKLNLRL